MKSLSLLATAFLVAASMPLPAAAEPAPTGAPVVFVSGTTGTKLADPRTGKLVWGRTAPLFRPRDRGYALALPLDLRESDHPQGAYRPIGPLLRLRLGLWTKQIYRPLLDHFLAEGRRLGDLREPRTGDDFFFFDYDWRRGNEATVFELSDRLSALSRTLTEDEAVPLPVDLICQSNAAKVCRYLVKYGRSTLEQAEAGVPRPSVRYRIRKLILVGASNGGALRTLEFMTRGRRYVPLVGRKISQETFFSVRPLFSDLPLHRDDAFFDESGETLAVDLSDPLAWIEYGWSIFAKNPRKRLARGHRPDLFENREDRTEYLANELDRASRLQRLLMDDAPHFEPARYYHLENESVPTAARALLYRGGGRWRIGFFDDRRVARDPTLRRLAVGSGDGHATLASQRRLSPQEQAALAGSALIVGGHFEMIIEPQGLSALSSFLAD